jgi:cytochrome c biogenesis protein CcmG/thiol:disulfide interchange protein DsbE
VNRVRPGGAVLLALVLMALLAAEASACGSSGGDKAQPLSGTTLDGISFDLASYHGKPVVVNFFASWCPPCNSEAPDLVAFARAHPEVAFVGVDVNDKQADAQGFVNKYGLPYPIVYDPNGAVGGVWKVDGIPTTFFIDANGVVKAHIVGAADKATFEAELQKAK